ncbi:GNAT family N-acetyltransferase [Paenibacillus sp. TRM 82003]|nr:GNAT family N-acetyltransferase [Paenibacillus sp. TRM 82003]
MRIRKTEDEADLQYVIAAEADEANRPYITPWSLERHREALTEEDLLHLVVEDADGRRVGFAILLGATSTHGTVELLRLVVTEKGRGYGRATIQAVQAFAFAERKARRLWLDVRERNFRARRLYESCGFRIEGCMRDACFTMGGGYESLLVMSILAHEYEPDRVTSDPASEEVLQTLKELGIVSASSGLSPRMKGKTDGRVFAIYEEGAARFALKYDRPEANRNATLFLQTYANGWLPAVRYIDPEYRYFLYDYLAGRPGAEAATVRKAEWMGALAIHVINRYRPLPKGRGWGWLDESPSATWADVLELLIGDARRGIGAMLTEEDHLLSMKLVDAKRSQVEPTPYLLHGDCGAHNFLFDREGLRGVIDPSPMIGPPLYDAIFAFCSTPDDLSQEAFEASLRELDASFLNGTDRKTLIADLLLILYARISTSLKYGVDAADYIRAWVYWKKIYASTK